MVDKMEIRGGVDTYPSYPYPSYPYRHYPMKIHTLTPACFLKQKRKSLILKGKKCLTKQMGLIF